MVGKLCQGCKTKIVARELVENSGAHKYLDVHNQSWLQDVVERVDLVVQLSGTR